MMKSTTTCQGGDTPYRSQCTDHPKCEHDVTADDITGFLPQTVDPGARQKLLRQGGRIGWMFTLW